MAEEEATEEAQEEATEAETATVDSAAEALEEEAVLAAEDSEVISLPERCIKQSALTASRNAKFPSSLQKEGRYSAGIASKTTRSFDGV